MQTRHWLCGLAAALALALAVPAAQAAPLGTALGNGRTATEQSAGGVQAVHWRRDRYYRHGYWPRRYHRYYGYRYEQPYRHYYGYGPTFGFYGYPRYYDRWWW